MLYWRREKRKGSGEYYIQHVRKGVCFMPWSIFRKVWKYDGKVWSFMAGDGASGFGARR